MIYIAIFISFFLLIAGQNDDFTFPEVQFEAFQPKGFRAWVPDMAGLKLVALHMNINKDIRRNELGELTKDILKPVDGKWVYESPNLALEIGDVINYWIFVQYKNSGHAKENLRWEMTKYVPYSKSPQQSIKCDTILANGKKCDASPVFQDSFKIIDANKWIVEHFIPTESPNYEFVSYQKSQCFVKDDMLYLQPKIAKNDDEVNGVLDLSANCTKDNYSECRLKSFGVFILPPITSAQIISKFQFRFGQVEIRAKLPCGDWIYPQMYLESASNPGHKLWIAYSRGNDELTGSDGLDVGGRLLFGGPVLEWSEPGRSRYLSSKSADKPFCNDFHTYKLIWKKNQISLFVDNEKYGETPENTVKNIKFAENDFVKLVLGVGVGGVHDFPDNFRSGNAEKPWKNKERMMLKQFFTARNVWKNTWDSENSAFKIDYVTINSI